MSDRTAFLRSRAASDIDDAIAFVSGDAGDAVALAFIDSLEPVSIGCRAIRSLVIRRGIGNDIATHRVIGRSSTKLLDFLMRIPTETGSMWIGPSDNRCACTASKTGRSCTGPVEKYSSMVIAG